MGQDSEATHTRRRLTMLGWFATMLLTALGSVYWLAVALAPITDLIGFSASSGAPGAQPDPWAGLPWFAVMCVLAAWLLVVVGLVGHLGRHALLVAVCGVTAGLLLSVPVVLPASLTGVLQSSVWACDELPCLVGGRGLPAGSRLMPSDITIVVNQQAGTASVTVHPSVQAGYYPYCPKMNGVRLHLGAAELTQTSSGGTTPGKRGCEPPRWAGPLDAPARAQDAPLVLSEEGREVRWEGLRLPGPDELLLLEPERAGPGEQITVKHRRGAQLGLGQGTALVDARDQPVARIDPPQTQLPGGHPSLSMHLPDPLPSPVFLRQLRVQRKVTLKQDARRVYVRPLVLLQPQRLRLGPP